jgi:aspartate racemase
MSKSRRARVSRRDALRILSATGAFTLAPKWNGGVRAAEIEDARGFKTIGVLGGLGPQATMDFEARLHKVAQRLIPQRANGGYPPTVVYYHRHPPVLVNDDLSPRWPIQADPRLLEIAKRLGAWADFIVMPSNGPHLVLEQIERASGRVVLSMIDVTVAEVVRRGWRRVGVLGFGDPVVYTSRLAPVGGSCETIDTVSCETIDIPLRHRLDREIVKVMEGADDAASAAVAREAVEALRERNVDGIILGCTELPLLLKEASDLVNPAQLLAEAAVRRAIT